MNREKYFLVIIIIAVMLLTGCSPVRTMAGGYRYNELITWNF